MARHLDAKHRDELHASGLTDETIGRSGIYSADGDTVRAILGWQPKAGKWGRGFVIPFTDANGANGHARFKPDFPRTAPQSPKAVKYETPRRTPNRAYFPPGFFKSDSAEIIVTEGEKKSLAGMQAGFTCIGLIGVYGWQEKRAKRKSGSTTGPKKLIDDLNAIHWHDKVVYVVFDSDASDNPKVRKAANELAAILYGQGARVSVQFVPPGPAGAKWGLDDFLVAHGDDGPAKLRERLDRAKGFVPADNTAASMGPMDLAAEIIAERFTHENIQTIRYHNAEYYVWDGRKYRRMPIADMEAHVLSYLDAKIKGARPKDARDVTKCLGAWSLVPFTAEPPVWIGNPKEAPGPRKSCIAVSNGILNLDAAVAGDVDALRSHSPLWFSLTALPYAYDVTAECPGWLAFLADVFDGDRERVELVQEWFGLCLTRDTSHQAILLLEGPRRSGKGTTLRMLRAVVGDDNTVAPRLSTLGELFGLQGLVGKTLAICPDAHLGHGVRALGVLEVLKSISGEDAIEVHRKHLPSITVRLGVRFALAVNELPKFGDASNALASRLLILPYRKSFQGREDRHLEERLSTEVKGVLNWAIAGLRRLRQNGRFIAPAISREILDDFERLTSPVKAFVEAECSVDPGAVVGKDRLWIRWQGWCERTGHDAESNIAFAVKLRSLLPQIQAKRPRGGQGRRTQKWGGIGLLKHASGGGQGGQG